MISDLIRLRMPVCGGAVLEILSGCQSLQELERFAIRHHATLIEA